MCKGMEVQTVGLSLESLGVQRGQALDECWGVVARNEAGEVGLDTEEGLVGKSQRWEVIQKVD